jgi:hypothetical protein
MASFLLIDDYGGSRDPVVRVVDSTDYANVTNPVTIDYLNWSEVGDVLRLNSSQHLVRLGAYRMVPWKITKKE